MSESGEIRTTTEKTGGINQRVKITNNNRNSKKYPEKMKMEIPKNEWKRRERE